MINSALTCDNNFRIYSMSKSIYLEVPPSVYQYGISTYEPKRVKFSPIKMVLNYFFFQFFFAKEDSIHICPDQCKVRAIFRLETFVTAKSYHEIKEAFFFTKAMLSKCGWTYIIYKMYLRPK